MELVLAAAKTAVIASGAEVSPAKINKIVRRFCKALARSRMGWCEFLDNKAHQRWVKGDPILVETITYLDPTGTKAARNVDRERGW